MNARFFQFALAAAIASLAVGADAFSAVNAQSFSYQGRVLNSVGTAPITGTAELKFEILNHAKDCVLYAEKQSVDLGTTGTFAVQVGSPTGDAKRTAAGNDSGNAMAIVFANSGSVPGVGSGCPYSPAAGDVRYLRVTVTPTAGTPVTLDPDQALGSLPQAIVAETLQGKGPTEFVQVTGNGSTTYSLAKTDLDKIFGAADAQGLHHHDNEYVKLGSTPSFSSLTISGTPTASTDASSKGYADSKFGGLTLDLSGLSSNQSIKWDGSKWVTFSAAEISSIPSCAAGQQLKMSTGPLYSWSCESTTVADGGITAAKLGSDVGFWGVDGTSVHRSAGNVGIGTTNPTEKLEVNGNASIAGSVSATSVALTGTIKLGTSSTCGPATEGSLRYNSSSHKPEYCDGSNWVLIGGNTDNSPDSFGFTNQYGAVPGAVVTSNSVVVSGFDGPATATCNGCTVDRNQSGTFAASTSGFMPGDLIRIRRNAGASSTIVTSWVVLGNTASSTWSVGSQGEAAFTTPGSSNWVVPEGVTSISVVCVGGGGGASNDIGTGNGGQYGGGAGGSWSGTANSGGGGGGLAYKNNISVTPGQSYTVVVGAGGVNVTDGGTSSFGAIITATGGKKGSSGDGSPGGAGGVGSGGDGNFTGGQGGSSPAGYIGGGGGAAGYAGNGGSGSSSGSHAGGSASTMSSSSTGGQGGSGGYGGGGGGGTPLGGSYTATNGSTWTSGGSPNKGGDGACRIIWPGNTRSFPNNAN